MITPDQMTPEEMKRRSRGISGDMSPEAISKRMDILAQLYELTTDLLKARKVEAMSEEAATKKE